MRLVQFLEATAIDDLYQNPMADYRSHAEQEEDFADGRTFQNPLPHLTPNDPRWGDWYDRGDDVINDWLIANGLGWRDNVVRAKKAVSQTMRLPIDKLITTERYLDPTALKRQHGDKFSSDRPIIYKVDGNYVVTDGNHRVVQAFLQGQKDIEVDVIDVDAFERQAA